MTDERNKRLKKAIGVFSVSYILFASFGFMLALGTLARGMADGVTSGPDPGQLASSSFIMHLLFLIMVLSQFWFLIIKPNRKKVLSSKRGQKSYYKLAISYLAVLSIVLLAIINYVVRVGSYYVGSDSWETYPQGSSIHSLDLFLNSLSILASASIFFGGLPFIIILIIVYIRR